MNYIEYDNKYGSFEGFIATVMTIQIYYCLNEHPNCKIRKIKTKIDDNKMTLSLSMTLDNKKTYTLCNLSIKGLTKYDKDDIHKNLIDSGLMFAIKSEYRDKYLDIDNIKELFPGLYPIIKSINKDCIKYGLALE